MRSLFIISICFLLIAALAQATTLPFSIEQIGTSIKATSDPFMLEIHEYATMLEVFINRDNSPAPPDTYVPPQLNDLEGIYLSLGDDGSIKASNIEHQELNHFDIAKVTFQLPLDLQQSEYDDYQGQIVLRSKEGTYGVDLTREEKYAMASKLFASVQAQISWNR